jgi:DNA replication protein DnaC
VRLNNKIERLIKQDCFRVWEGVADVEYESLCNLDKNMFIRFTSLAFIKRKENILITVDSSTGKSYLFLALGYQTCLIE